MAVVQPRLVRVVGVSDIPGSLVWIAMDRKRQVAKNVPPAIRSILESAAESIPTWKDGGLVAFFMSLEIITRTTKIANRERFRASTCSQIST
jgi:hypothetical protein